MLETYELTTLDETQHDDIFHRIAFKELEQRPALEPSAKASADMETVELGDLYARWMS